MPSLLITQAATITLYAGPTCRIVDTVNVRDRATKKIQDVRPTLQTHKYTTAEGEYKTEQIKKLVYDVSPTRGSEIFWMPPATKDTTTPMPNLGEREARQKPAIWKPPSGTSALTMVITDGQGVKRNLSLTDKGHITWFKKNKSGELEIEERQADDDQTILSVEVNDTANTAVLTKTKIMENKTVQSTSENIY